MTKPRTSAIVSGLLSLAFVMPAAGQADEADRQRQEQRALLELVQELQLQLDDDEFGPDEALNEQRRRVEAIRRRMLQMQQQQPRLFEEHFPAEPLQLDAEPVVSPWAKRTREEVVAGLDHAEFAVRESAYGHLLTDNTLSKDALKGLIQKAKSPEQRHRLLRLAEHHLLREMRQRDFGHPRPGDGPPIPQVAEPRPASVGYSYDPVLAQDNPQANLPGVRVVATMPGFPGHAHLRRGDIIVQINGRGLSIHHGEGAITDWVKTQIASKQAGQTIDFTVLRSGKPLAIRMVCAEGAALNHMYTTDAFEAAARKEPYQRAWEAARAELTGLMPKPKPLTPKVIEAG
ncbi:MAG: PDZ domain-containing protein [Phycisphaeraceae bacterium]|nr:PDZ domain-containing protein [Phycisphaeraceae bacterium]